MDKYEEEHQEDVCPVCALRSQLTAQLAASPDGRRRLLDELLDAVEAVRWVDTAGGSMRADAAGDAAGAVMSVVHTMQDIADDAASGDD